VTAPLFLDLSSPALAHLVGPNFAAEGRTQEVAVFRFDVPTQAGISTTIIMDTCDPATTFGTFLAAFDECYGDLV